jgi:hypothetical protein
MKGLANTTDFRDSIETYETIYSEGKHEMTENKMEETKGFGAGGVVTNENRPEFIPASTDGTDHIEREDFIMPRIAIAQGLSPQIIEGDAKFIEGLKVGDMFNSITGQIYKRGPMNLFVIRGDKPRGVEFVPLDEGGGVKDPDVPMLDPRMQFTEGSDGKVLKPIATKFYDFIVVLLPSMEVVGLSFKSTGLKTAKRLNSLIKLRRAAIFAGVYVLTSAIENKGPKKTYGVYRIENAGWLPDSIAYNLASDLFESFKEKEVIFHTEDEQPTEEEESKADHPEVPF